MILRSVYPMMVIMACQPTRLTPAKNTPVTPGGAASSASASGKRAPSSPCDTNDDCASGYCIDNGSQHLCTARCADERDCVSPLVCKRADGHDAESPLICAPATDSLCHPCTQDSDCGAYGDLCLTGKNGAACGRDCSADGSCPTDFSCQAQTGSDGKVFGKQCVPNKQSCACNDATAGQTRPCVSSNAFGTCRGSETCNPDTGFVGCTAAVASAEVCDGLDNNCNGAIDEQPDHPERPLAQACGNGHAPCVGVETCSNGVFAGCTAALPQAETCNGIDDNCDGLIDEGLLSSADSCGACGNVCPPGAGFDNSTQRFCVDHGQGPGCGPIACLDPYYDVDGSAANGCELRDDLPMHATAGTALGADGGGPACQIWDSDNNWCDYTSRLPADAAIHVQAPVQRDSPVAPVNNEEWFVAYAHDQYFAELDVESRLDVSTAPASNLYEFCQSTAHDDAGMGDGCGARPVTGDFKWCSGACCCAYGGQVIGMPTLSLGSSSDDSGNYYVRVRWLSGAGPTAGNYAVRICDDSGPKHCE